MPKAQTSLRMHMISATQTNHRFRPLYSRQSGLLGLITSITGNTQAPALSQHTQQIVEESDARAESS